MCYPYLEIGLSGYRSWIKGGYDDEQSLRREQLPSASMRITTNRCNRWRAGTGWSEGWTCIKLDLEGRSKSDASQRERRHGRVLARL